MIITFFFKDRPPYSKDVHVDRGSSEGSWTLEADEPPPDGRGTLVGFDVEGLNRRNFLSLIKTPDMDVTVNFKGPGLVKLVEDEKFLVECSDDRSLPLVVGRVRTQSGRKALNRRLKGSA